MITTEKQTSYLTIEKQEGVGIIWMDMPGENVNKISLDLVDEFEKVFQQIQNDTDVKAAVLISRKKSFIAGADIEKFLEMGPGEAAKAALGGHAMLNKLGKSKKPFVAAINGACMGGGLELSMACAGRVVSKEGSTVLALPEVKLGLLPGMGGTYRLPRLVGIQKALDMMLTGKNIYASQAYKMGLADDLVDSPKLLSAAKKLALKIAKAEFQRKSKLPLASKILESALMRNIIFTKAKEMTLRATYGNYPAPIKILESVRFGLGHTQEEASKKETQLFDELLQTPQSKQLINIFFAMTDMKKNPMKDKVKEVETLAILGSGFMGEGIAEVSVQNKMDVMLKDISADTIAQAKSNIWKALSKKIKNKSLIKADAETLINKVTANLDYSGFHKADMVIEAVFEDLKIKHKVLQETEAALRPDCIFASNTSALPISEIAKVSKRPENIIGMHYFSPVPKMPLLEIIITDKTADWVTATALEVGIRQGKTCIVVKDGPGFYTTRILCPLLNEALLMLEEGADMQQLDKVMRQFGFPVGPVTLMDEVGIDVGAHITEGGLGDLFEKRGGKASDAMKKMAEAGFKGRKNKKGFFLYDEKTGKKIRGKVNEEAYRFFGGNTRKQFSPQEIQDRISLMMVNEAVYCLQEGILLSARDGDMGAVFGLGFPPFLGGPFRYIDYMGADKIVEKMELLQQKCGARFKPASMLAE
jgi:3-hydroxyacyl-CoA dehydrogenase/enoyl-CoA hydratase/3-hydroxybutyryl-CoA epimerase